MTPYFVEIYVDGREKSENVFCFYLTKSRECSYFNHCAIQHLWLSTRAFSALRRIEAENVFTFLSTINKNEIEPGSDKFPTCAKSLLVSYKIRLSARICLCFSFSSVGLFVSRCSNLGCFVFVDGREKSENVFYFYSTKSRENTSLNPQISG